MKIFFVIMLMEISGCHEYSEADSILDSAERFMEERPDSALSILDEIDASMLKGNRVRARYALLKSMALDKNYIDITTFDVLQPAIEYYLKNGNVDEKLRTHYYQGVIHSNAGNDDLAMQSYLSGLDNLDQISDSLTFARMLVAKAALCYKQYQINEVVDDNLQAAKIYRQLGKLPQQLNCYLRVLNGEIILGDKLIADSILMICNAIVKDSPSLKNKTLKPYLKYAVIFGNKEEVGNQIEEVCEAGISDDMKMTLARAYTRIDQLEIALQYLNEAKLKSENILDSLTYWSVKTEILENFGEDREALYAFRNYSRLLEAYHLQLFSNELLFSEKKHEMEIDNMAKIRKKEDVITVILIVVAVLISLMALIYYRYRLNKAARLLAESNAEKLQMEGDNQRLRAEKLESERTRLQLEAENLHHKIEEMEGEKERLKELLGRQETLSEEARELIRERISMLNGLIAQALTEQESYGKEFKKYIVKIKKDKKGFQQSLVKVLATTHPEFIAYLREHGLTERELNYCCLYAIGMRGKEIGTYLDLARHYNISTEVRRKLGLDTNSENLGPFLRQLMDKGD
ncbi:MAG: hypothetical protein K2J58_03190 [Muribaculaceae bacterium]|nr:hypothetical protein [Muribaculaceae bacterium]